MREGDPKQRWHGVAVGVLHESCVTICYHVVVQGFTCGEAVGMLGYRTGVKGVGHQVDAGS